MKVVMVFLATLAALAGATVSTATAPVVEPTSLESLEAEINLQLDERLRNVLADLRAS